jgi:hypothetical protein
MKDVIKYAFILLIVMDVFAACAKKELKFYSDYIWKPDTEEGRKLKLLYQEELYNVYKRLSFFNIPVQKSGIGFTISEKCQTEGCTYEELNKLWLFIASPVGESVSAKAYNSFENRAEYIIENKLPDLLLAIKTINFEKVFKDKRFDGFLFSFTWGVKEFPKDIIGNSAFETARVYIPKNVYVDYVNNKIDINELLNLSEVYLKTGKNTSKRIYI